MANAGPGTAARIFRDYDQAALDREVNLRARWPDHPAFFERWARDSAAVRAALPAQLDLPYGEDPAETLDLFPVPGAAAAPLLAFIHGGYWQALDKGDYSYLAPPFVEAGIAFASLNYGLAPDTGIGTMIDQVRRAQAWLHRNAAALGVDPRRIVVAGHSAGGHLAVMALSTDWTALDPDLPGDLLAGACSISGVYDLEPIRLSYHNKVLGIAAAEVGPWSPLHRLPARSAPLLMAVGAEETREFLRQHAEYAAAWQARGLPLAEVAMPGLHHFSAVDALGDRDHPLHGAVRQLLAGRLA
ncbi:MAG: alpha/beta hydrolase [Kiloniellaceae bacterium]